ncbi:MAG: iron ABC transporter permease, partial [Rubrivivax sp.]|nr:iron ABC transporter permease [Rubrivivax sp.]
MNRGRQRARSVLLAWLALGAAAFVLLPWYFPQNLSLLKSLPGVFGGSETASALVHALQHGRPWLWLGLAGLLLCAVAWRMAAGRPQGWTLVAGSLL